MRDGQLKTVDAAKSDREQQITDISVPLLFSYKVGRGHADWSILLGFVRYQSTAAAWQFRLLWLISFGGGDADQLLEQGS